MDNGFNLVADVWEWHPIYGVFSRIIYKQVNDTYGKRLVMVGRQYSKEKF